MEGFELFVLLAVVSVVSFGLGFWIASEAEVAFERDPFDDGGER